MVVRGRLAFDDQGRLVEIAEDAQDPTNPQPDEIQPVEFAEIIADELSTELVSTGESLTELLPTLDVDAFGAVGDGQTDDRDAIIAAVDSLEDGQQAILNFSAGKEYYVGSTPTVSPADVPIIDMSGSGLVVDGSYAAFEYAGSHTSNSDPSTGDTQALETTELGPRIIDFEARSTEPLSGIYVGVGLILSNVFGLSLERPYCHSLNHAVQLQGTSRNLSINAPHIYDNRTSGVRFNGVNIHQVDINGGYIQHAETPILIDSGAQVYNFQLPGADIEVNGGGQQLAPAACIQLANGRLQEASFDGCTVQGHSESIPLIDLQDTSRCVTLSDNHLSNADYAVRASSSADVRELTISGGTAKNLNYIFNTTTTNNLHGLSLSDITAEDAFLANINASATVGPVSITNIPIRPGDLDDDWLYVHGDAIRGLHVEDVNAYPNGTYGNTGWMLNVEYENFARLVQIKNNKLYTRDSGGVKDGIRVQSTDIDGGHIKDNVLQDVPSGSTAFDLPADSSTFAVSGNQSI